MKRKLLNFNLELNSNIFCFILNFEKNMRKYVNGDKYVHFDIKF